MFKFIHAADIHLDSPLHGLARYDGAPVDELRGATRESLKNLVRLALAEQVDFVLIAGDVYDGDWIDTNTGLFFCDQMRRLSDAEIPVVMISGNHDAANVMSRDLPLPHRVSRLSSNAPETVLLESHQAAIHGQSFATKAVRENLSAAYPAAKPGWFNIGLLHTALDGRSGHGNYAPCTAQGLIDRGYQYWALGHVHTRETICQQPFIAFPGNIQGRHIREPGERGCLLVSVDNNHETSVEFRPLSVLRWESVTVDLDERAGDSASDAIDAVVDQARMKFQQLADSQADQLLAVRVAIRGRTAADRTVRARQADLTASLRAVANQAAAGRIWLERVKVETFDRTSHEMETAVPGGALEEIESLFAHWQAELDSTPQDSTADPPLDRLSLTGLSFPQVYRRIADELVDDVLPPEDPEWISEALRDARGLLLDSAMRQEQDG